MQQQKVILDLSPPTRVQYSAEIHKATHGKEKNRELHAKICSYMNEISCMAAGVSI